MLSINLIDIIVEEKQNNIVLVDLVACLWKHKLGMLIIFVTIMLVVVITTLRITPIYEIKSSVLVKYGREYVYRPVEKVQEGDISPFRTYSPSTIINTELEIFNSSELAEEVVKSVGVEKLFPDLVQNVQDKWLAFSIAVQKFRGMLKASHIPASNVISVTLQHHDPNIAVQAVSDLIERFKDRHLEIYKNPEISFLEQQVTRYAQELQEAEETKRSYKQMHNIFSLIDQRHNLILQYGSINTSLILENGALDEWLEKQISLEKQMETVPEFLQFEDSSQSEEKTVHESKLLQLKLQERTLREKYPENNRLVIAVREEIELVEKFILENPATAYRLDERNGINELYLVIEQQLVAARAEYEGKKKKVESIGAQAEQIKIELQKLSDHEIDIKRLNDKVEAAGLNYINIKEKLDKSRIQEIMDKEKLVNVVVIDKPRVPLKPIKPKKKLRILVGLILSFASSIFYVLFREYALGSEK